MAAKTKIPDKTILGGKEFKLEDLPFTSLKKFIPAVGAATSKLKNVASITESDFDLLLQAVYVGISHCNDITLEALGALPIKIQEIAVTLSQLVVVCGLEEKKAEKGE